MTLRGIVVRGKGEGRRLGYPTANLLYVAGSAPESGVWLTRAHAGFAAQTALAVVGMWKINGDLPSVEVHLLDFVDDLYGKELTLSLVEKLRDLEQFTEHDALVARIQKDVEEARRYFLCSQALSKGPAS